MVEEQHAHTAMGIGCLTFVSIDEHGAEVRDMAKVSNPNWWKEQIESELGRLTSITDLRVDISGNVGMIPSGADILNEYLDEYDIDYDFGPAEGSFIGFTITIPKRIQSETYPPGYELSGERFKFITVYAGSGPVTFIRNVDTPDPSPSSYVILVREFLKRELKKLGSTLAVKAIGPSPFWGSFTLSPSSDITSDLAVDWKTNRRGYDDIAILYNADLAESGQAHGKAVSLLSANFSEYYFQVRASHRRYLRSTIVAELTDDLMVVHRASGLRGWFAKNFRSGQMARELLLAAITAKQLDVEERSRTSAHLVESRNAPAGTRVDLPELDAKCQAEADETYVDQLSMAQEVAGTLESGRISQFEVLVVSASTVLGAAAGAIAALIAG
ncbi:hypothetical protein ACWDTD_07755 [Gordonia sp. NPDC003425]